MPCGAGVPEKVEGEKTGSARTLTGFSEGFLTTDFAPGAHRLSRCARDAVKPRVCRTSVKAKTVVNQPKTPTKVRYDRRRFLRDVVLTIAAAEGIMVASAAAQPDRSTPPTPPPTDKPTTDASFAASLKQVNAGVLNVGYAEAGPVDGPAVILLHVWPYDIQSYAEVAPRLAAAGYRVIVPYLRGYGPTRFLSAATVRNGQQSVFAADAIALMDALGVERAIVGGYDWGARTANVLAALWPERCRGLVSVSGYLIGSPKAGEAPLPPRAELAWWYQFYFATERGRLGYGKYRRDFARLIWQLASPRWDFDDATFERSAAAFDNPDHVRIVIHNYRWRLGLAEGEPRYDELERRLAAAPTIGVPTITLEWMSPPPRRKWVGKNFSYETILRWVVRGHGHRRGGAISGCHQRNGHGRRVADLWRHDPQRLSAVGTDCPGPGSGAPRRAPRRPRQSRGDGRLPGRDASFPGWDHPG